MQQCFNIPINTSILQEKANNTTTFSKVNGESVNILSIEEITKWMDTVIQNSVKNMMMLTFIIAMR